MSTDLTRLPTRSLPANYARIEGSRYAVGQELRRAERRGEIRRVTEMTEVNRASGTVVVVVEKLRDPAPRWRKPVIIGVVALAVLIGVAWAGYEIATTTMTVLKNSGPAALGIILLVGLVLGLAGTILRPERIIEGTFRARIK